jgi:DNA-directed RNA polymerase I subunit RPA2
MLHMAADDGVLSRAAALALIGSRFRVVLERRTPPWYTDEQVGEYLIGECVCAHLESNRARVDCLAYMARKLIALMRGEILTESPDNPQFQEAVTPGHLMMLLMKERLEVSPPTWITYLRTGILESYPIKSGQGSETSYDYLYTDV